MILIIKEIKYFSIDGSNNVPNGHTLQKGGFIKECIDNSNKFHTENYQYMITKNFNILEAIHPNQYGLFDHKGGIIIFSNFVNSLEISNDFLINWLIKKIKKINKSDKKIDDYIGAFSIGNFFSGRYVGDNGDIFNENSITIEVNGISSKGLIYLAKEIMKYFNQETLLLKDLNINKIFSYSHI
jgi:hypothetical protein